MKDALARERLGERLQLLHQPPADDCRVVRQGLVADVYLLKFHGAAGYRRARRIS
jgi:putative component of toxin-antitoxin plasmid stabilization module